MQISTLQENLKYGLNIVSHAAGKNINLPILNNVMIKAEKGNIKLITTDLEIGITNMVRGRVEKEGVFTVNVKVMADYISLLPNQKLDIKQKENQLLIQSVNYKTAINGQSADEFPLIPNIDKKEAHYKTSIDNFKNALSQVIFAVSTSEARSELTGALFSLNKENLVMAATDSYRLAEKTVKIFSNIEDEKRIIIPAKTLQKLTQILSGLRDEELKTEKDINFYLSDNQVLFKVGNTELVSRIIEGRYPDYKQIIPTSSETSIIINKEELNRAVKASALFSKTGINDINIDFPVKKNKVIISSASSQMGENIVELEADIQGRDNGIVINCRYLLDGINNINSENIKMEITNSNTPCVLKPHTKDSEKNNYSYVIMPIKQ